MSDPLYSVARMRTTPASDGRTDCEAQAVAARLRALRQRAGITQADLALRLGDIEGEAAGHDAEGLPARERAKQARALEYQHLVGDLLAAECGEGAEAAAASRNSCSVICPAPKRRRQRQITVPEPTSSSSK